MYIIGHKNPDTDSIVAALAYAELKRRLGVDAVAARAGELNPETQFVLRKFGAEPPQLLKNAEGAVLILVDHNEESQMVDGHEKAKIVEIVDHHRLGGLVTADPIFVHIEPVGATSTIIAKWYFEKGLELDKKLAGLLLCAILSDTVIFKSPTCTDDDRAVAARLAEIAGVSDVKALGIEMFKAKSGIASKSPREILLTDFKEYVFGGVKVGIGQVETVDLSEVEARRDELLEAMREVKEERGYGLLILMLTDIIEEGSLLLYLADRDEWFLKALSCYKLEPRGPNAYYAKGVMSRKKQIVPPLQKYFSSSQ